MSLIRRQQGVSLLEAMISLLIISIGLLGIATLQVTSMKQNASALNHSQAVWLGYDMADRIRSNTSEFANYAGLKTSDGNSRDCIGAACSTAQMIIADEGEWATQIQNLPGGLGWVTGDATQLNVMVMWDDDGKGGAGTGCSGDPTVDLTCYTVTLVQ